MNFSKIVYLVFLIASAVLCLTSAESQGRKIAYRRKRDHGHGVTGPVHTFVKTDKHANFKWGVRHHVGHQYAGRK